MMDFHEGPMVRWCRQTQHLVTPFSRGPASQYSNGEVAPRLSLHIRPESVFSELYRRSGDVWAVDAE